MTVLKHVRLLPLLVIVAFISFTIRVGEFASGFSRGGTALAQHEVTEEEKHPPPLPAEAAEKAAIEAVTHTEKKEADKDTAEKVHLPPALPTIADKPTQPVEWKDSVDTEFEMSPVQENLYKDLAQRRKDLETREKTLATREALLEAGERELDQKLRELTTIKNEIEGLLKAQSEEEKGRVKSLVSIYEGMKAKDAAGIFNTLDIDVLITIFTNMSERKSGAILAEMNPERARTVTILMAQQRQLPATPMQ